MKIYKLYYHNSQEEQQHYCNGTITECINEIEGWFCENGFAKELEEDGDVETLEKLKYFFKNPTEWFDRRNEINGLWDDEFWYDFYIEHIYTVDLSKINK